MEKTKKLTLTALIAALTSVSSSFIYIPIGFAKIFPIQHLANLLSAVLLGPWYAVIQAFLSSTIRNMLGTGSLFAYPGSMIGALFAAILFAKTNKIGYAAIGEVIGTGIIGAFAVSWNFKAPSLWWENRRNGAGSWEVSQIPHQPSAAVF